MIPFWPFILVVASVFVSVLIIIFFGIKRTLFLLAFLIPFQIYINLTSSFTITFVQCLVGTTFIFWLHQKLSRRDFSLSELPLSIPLTAFLGIIVLSVVVNPSNLVLSLKQLIRWMSPILILLVVTDTIREKKEVKRLIGAVLLSGGLLSVMAIIQFLVGAERIRDFLNTDIAALLLNRHIIEAGELNLFIGNYSYVRAFGTFTNVNTFSAYLGWIIPLSLVFLISKIPIYRRYWLGLVALLLGNALILISSRAGILGLLSATSLIFFLIEKKGKVWLICWLGLLVVTACIFFPKAFLTLSQRGIEVVSGGAHSVSGGAYSVSGGAHSVTSRFFIWKKGLEMIKEHPLIGVGPGNCRIEVPKNISSRPTLPPHNMFLLVAGEMGIPGFLIYLLILWIIFKEIVVLFKRSTDLEIRSIALGLSAGLVWFIVQSFFSHFLLDIKYGMLFWLMVGVSFSLKSVHSLKDTS